MFILGTEQSHRTSLWSTYLVVGRVPLQPGCRVVVRNLVEEVVACSLAEEVVACSLAVEEVHSLVEEGHSLLVEGVEEGDVQSLVAVAQ